MPAGAHAGQRCDRRRACDMPSVVASGDAFALYIGRQMLSRALGLRQEQANADPPGGSAFENAKSGFGPSPKNVAESISKDERAEVGPPHHEVGRLAEGTVSVLRNDETDILSGTSPKTLDSRRSTPGGATSGPIRRNSRQGGRWRGSPCDASTAPTDVLLRSNVSHRCAGFIDAADALVAAEDAVVDRDRFPPCAPATGPIRPWAPLRIVRSLEISKCSWRKRSVFWRQRGWFRPPTSSTSPTW